MNPTVNKLLFWSPRVLGILIAIFVSLFALDVFAEGSSSWEIVVALAMHLIPTFVILIALATFVGFSSRVTTGSRLITTSLFL